MNEKFGKLILLLEELFQLDQPELDFGFYREMHARSTEVSNFLDSHLLPQVRAAFNQYRYADKRRLKRASAIRTCGCIPSLSRTLPP